MDAAVEQAVAAALAEHPEVPAVAAYYAITDVRQEGDWALVSVLGLAQVEADLSWGIDDGAWLGLVLLGPGPDGGMQAAARGTEAFVQLIAQAPESFISPEARRDLERTGSRTPLAAGDYVFPWQPGTSMYYGNLGVHNNGFNFDPHVGWKAVDMMSDGNTAQGHAPNDLRAAQAGTIDLQVRGRQQCSHLHEAR